MHVFFVLFSLLLPFANSVSFKITRFDPDVNSIIYRGDAVPSAGAVELIFRYTYTCRVGWATHAERVRIWDSNSGQLSNFTTHFSFIIDTEGRSAYGHGLAFFLAPVGFEIPLNSAGGFFGLYNTSTVEDSSQNQIVHVEFDSFPNPEWDPEPLVEHVGINSNSLSSAVHTPWNATFHSGDTADVWITYDATAKNLSVLWSYQKTSNPLLENYSLSHIIDLMKVLPEWVTIGFSSATGSNLERNQLLSWEFNSTLDVKETNSKRIRIIVGIAISVCVLTSGAMIKILISWRRRKQTVEKKEGEKVNLTSINEDLGKKSWTKKVFL
ncbi:hypothetical protein P3X46_018567 [Hevea brasiliensis]|uniref:Legume lectin domain-containing protein n=1 Tax=Hevea brasiliensis TaxID=3981 RepID=A0ABQ9LR39_HEVBR|nr:hypothetical protein P3X46_018567 [Hevea brasiliensis]